MPRLKPEKRTQDAVVSRQDSRRRSRQLPRFLVRINIAITMLVISCMLASCAFFYLSEGTVLRRGQIIITMSSLAGRTELELSLLKLCDED